MLAGLDGFWTIDGPTDRAQLAVHATKARGELTRAQRTVLSLAFYVWGRESDRVVTLRELLSLPPRETARVCEFLKGLSRTRRKGGAK